MSELSIHIQVEGLTKAEINNDISQFISELANAIPDATRQIIDESTPTGRLYRRGVMTGRRSQALIRMGLQPRGKTRVVTGRRIHRASTKGQPPAKDTGDLYNKIRVVGRGKFEKLVRFDSEHAGHAERLRPFLDMAVRRAIENIK